MNADKPAKKHHYAKALGRKGGLVGGKARAKKLTAQERSDAARKAAQARWSRRDISPRGETA